MIGQEFPETIDLSGAMGGGPGGPPAPGAGPQAPAGAPDATVPEAPEDSIGALREALRIVRGAAIAEKDDEIQAQIEEIGTKLANIVASEQKMKDAALGVTPAHKGIRRATQQGA